MNVRKFLEIENKYDLYNKQICGVNYWIFHRFDIWNYRICAQNLNLSTSYQKNRKKVGRTLRNISNCFQTKRIPKNNDVLFLNYGGRIKNGQYYDCAYTESLNRLAPNCVTIEEPFEHMHYRPVRTKNLVYTDYISLRAFIYWRIVKTVKPVKFKEIIKELDTQLGAALNEIAREYSWNFRKDELFYSIAKNIIRHDLVYKEYEKLISKINPKVIVEVSHYEYSKMIVNEVAKDKNIPVIELQHGTIYEEHVAYQYATKQKIKPFPDKIFLFSEFWKKRINAPVRSENLVAVGYPTFDEKIKQYSSDKNERTRYTILFVSQGTIGIYLSEVACNLARDLDSKKYRIIYKLHPSEHSCWKEQYPNLQDTEIEVVDNNTESIYKQFAESDMQIGVYSTALFEGLGFGLKTLILRVGHFEAMNSLVEEGYADYIDSAQDVIRILSEEPSSREQNSVEFWKKDALKNIEMELRQYF